MYVRTSATLLLVTAARLAVADNAPPFDAPVAFGALPTVTDLRLSPDGKNVAYLSPTTGQGSALFTLSLEPGVKPRIALSANGNPDRIASCNWVANDRLACIIYTVAREPHELSLQYVVRTVAVDAAGGQLTLLGKRTNFRTRGVSLSDTAVIDWLPDEDGTVLMERVTLPDDRLGTRVGSSDRGIGVDRVDTRTLIATGVETPNPKAVAYLSDGRGNVRIMALDVREAGGHETGKHAYLYRKKDSRKWEALSTYEYMNREGFLPVAVDPDLNVAYGLKKKDGRIAAYTVALDGSLAETLVYARDDVDIAGFYRIGRRQRVVGVNYATDYNHTHFLDAAIDRLAGALSRALPAHPALRITDSSVDESKLLIFAGSDVDAGVYYVFDRPSHQLQTFLVVRGALENVTLAQVKPISYPASDGTMVPGYLTLPAGAPTGKALPGIVLPHGGPGARDEWGFDWLAQFYASRGFAVLQPNFRGSAGYGDAWFQKNGFRSWRTAIGDVLDAGRWLVAQGTVDPNKLAIVGWSYGGYAALQSAVTDASVYKAVVAVAPVTDINELREQHRRWSDYYLAEDFFGDSPEVRAGSPAQNASKIRVPVLLFHGTDDVNVNYAQSELMDKALGAAGAKHEFVTFEHLDHYLDDSSARAEMLRKSDAFLRAALGL
jgi:dipeptidyl aminopeptidase/acylaminoacyl peptidase